MIGAISWQLILKLFRLGCSAAILSMIARNYDSVHFVQFSLSLTLSLVLTSIGSLGISQLIPKLISDCPENEGSINITSLVVVSFVSIVVYQASVILLSYAAVNFIEQFKIMGLSIVGYAALTVQEVVFQYKRRLKSYAVISIFILLIFLLVRVFLIFSQADFSILLWTFPAEAFLICISIVFSKEYRVNNFNRYAFSSTLSFYKKRAAKLVLLAAVFAAATKVDQFWIYQIFDQQEAAKFIGAARLIEYLFGVAPLFSATLISTLIYYSNRGCLGNGLAILNRYIFFASASAVAILLFLSEYILDIVYGENIVGAKDVFSVLIFSLIPQSMLAFHVKVYYLEDRVSDYVKLGLFLMCGSLFWTGILSLAFGLVGGALGFVINFYVTYFASQVFIVRDRVFNSSKFGIVRDS